jgi:hypothetical protein
MVAACGRGVVGLPFAVVSRSLIRLRLLHCPHCAALPCAACPCLQASCTTPPSPSPSPPPPPPLRMCACGPTPWTTACPSAATSAPVSPPARMHAGWGAAGTLQQLPASRMLPCQNDMADTHAGGAHHSRPSRLPFPTPPSTVAPHPCPTCLPACPALPQAPAPSTRPTRACGSSPCGTCRTPTAWC